MDAEARLQGLQAKLSWTVALGLAQTLLLLLLALQGPCPQAARGWSIWAWSQASDALALWHQGGQVVMGPEAFQSLVDEVDDSPLEAGLEGSEQSSELITPAQPALEAGRRGGLTVQVHVVLVAKPSAALDRVPVLLVRRRDPPFQDYWALPGGQWDETELFQATAMRGVREETSVDLQHIVLERVGTFVDPARDVGGWDSSHLAAANPPGWSVGVGYAALANSTDSLPVKAGGDVTEAAWHNVVDLPELAFDHLLILRTALRQLAEQQGPQQGADLAGRLRKAADVLEGPWQHHPDR